MRTIKFRGKRVDNGKWVYGYYVLTSNKYHQILSGTWHKASGSHNRYDVYHETVGQYIEIADAYEGDVIRIGLENRVIEFTEEAGFDLNPRYEPRTLFELASLGRIVPNIIGNIHDNPELIK